MESNNTDEPTVSKEKVNEGVTSPSVSSNVSPRTESFENPILPKKKRKLESQSSSDKIKKKIVKSEQSKTSSSGDAEGGKHDSDEGDEDDDDDSQSDADKNEYVYDDFVVPETAEDGSESDDDGDSKSGDNDEDEDEEKDKIKIQKSSKQKKQFKRLQKKKMVLDEDDIELIQENQFTSKDDILKSRFRGNNDMGEDNDDMDDENRVAGRGKKDDDNQEEEDDDEDGDIIQPQRRDNMYGGDESGSDVDSFIVDDVSDDGLDREPGSDHPGGISSSHGEDIRSKPVMPKRDSAPKIRRMRDGPTGDQIQDANDIFGIGYDDFSDEEEVVEAKEGEESEEEEEYQVDETGRIPIEIEEKRARKRLNKVYDRHILVENFCTERDDVLRKTDRPERFQDILANRTPPDDQERRLEAEWMAEKLTHFILSAPPPASTTNMMGTSVNSGGVGVPPKTANYFQRDIQLEKALIEPIENILRFYQIDQVEPPYIWCYRRDYLHERIRREDLWRILAWDEQWERLYSIKNKLFILLQAVQDSADSRGINPDILLQEEIELNNQQKSLELHQKFLNSKLNIAEMEYKEALDAVDEKDENATEEDRSNVILKNQAMENIQKEIQVNVEEVNDIRNKIFTFKQKKYNQNQFIPEMAVEVLRLFPMERYSPLITNAKSEIELKEISDFVFLLLKGAYRTNMSSTSEQTEKNMREGGSKMSKLKSRLHEKNMSQSSDVTHQDINIGMDTEMDGDMMSPSSQKSDMNSMTTEEIPHSTPDHSDGDKMNDEDENDDDDEDDKKEDDIGLSKKKKSDVDFSDDDGSDEEDDEDDGGDHEEDDDGNNDDEDRMHTTQEVDTEAVTFSQSLRHKIKNGMNTYDKYKKITKLREFIECFTVPAYEYGESILNGYKVEPPPTYDLPPPALAQSTYLDIKIFKNEQMLIQSVVNMIAVEYAHEPNIRKYTRELFLDEGSISTYPTAQGELAITAFHDLFGYHLLTKKPIRDFLYIPKDKSLFLKLYEAERNGLIRITVHYPEVYKSNHHRHQDSRNDNSNMSTEDKEKENINNALEYFLQSKKFLSMILPSTSKSHDMYPESRAQWDELRLRILKIMFEKYVFPTLQKDIRRELIKSSRESVIEEMANNLAQNLKIGPYHPPIENMREYTKQLLRNTPKDSTYRTIMGIHLVNGDRSPWCLAYVNKDGVMKAHVLIPDETTQSKKLDKVKQFIYENQPECIVINASGGVLSKSIQDTLEKALLPQVSELIMNMRKMKRESMSYMNGDEVDEDEEIQTYAPSVAIIKDELSNIYKHSSRAKKHFPELQPGICAAISLARYAQEPLMEYCSLWTSADAIEIFGYEFLYLDLHPMKAMLKGSKVAILRALEHVIVDAVCDVGVDINKAVTYDHIAPMLTFICGLGLRKADALRQRVKSTLKTVENREILLTKKLLGTNVWTNASGFLRITHTQIDDYEDYTQHAYHPLDNTRIHPECYITHHFVQKLCDDALEIPSHSMIDEIQHIESQMTESKTKLEEKIKKFPHWLDLWENGIHPIGYYNETTVIRQGRRENERAPVELNDALSELVLDEYLIQIEVEGNGKRKLQFEHLKEELRYPWLDLRCPMKRYEEKDLFTIITGESDSTLYVGLKVGCYVLDIKEMTNDRTGKRRQQALIKTDLNIRGRISIYDVIDDRIDEDTFDMNRYIQAGTNITAVVIGINKDRAILDLSIRPSYMNTTESWWIINRKNDKNILRWYNMINKNPEYIYDIYFQERDAIDILRKHEDISSDTKELSLKDKTSFEEDRGQGGGMGGGSGKGTSKTSGTIGKKMMVMRQVHHPLFHNCGYKEAEAKLTRDGKGAGDVLIRPSSKGPDMLAITWAFQDHWYAHIDLKEMDKKEGSLALGQKFIVQEPDMMDEIFTDLDEIYARYIEPMNDFTSSMITNVKFKTGSPEEIDSYLVEEHKKNPTRIPYCIRFEPGVAGVFVLTWYMQTSKKPIKTEKIMIRPQGYKIRKEIFPRVSDLINWFKKLASSVAEKQHQPPVTSTKPTAAQQLHRTLTSAVSQPPPSAGVPVPPQRRRSNLFSRAQAPSNVPMTPSYPQTVYMQQPSTSYMQPPGGVPYMGVPGNVPPMSAGMPPYQQPPPQQMYPPVNRPMYPPQQRY